MGQLGKTYFKIQLNIVNMKVLKTNSAHKIQLGRTPIETEVYLTIGSMRMTSEGIYPYGYYYCLHNGGKHRLSDVSNGLIQWDMVQGLETQLEAPRSINLKDIISQRAEEIMKAVLQIEGLSNFGIDPSDWEVYVAPPKAVNKPITENEENI